MRIFKTILRVVIIIVLLVVGYIYTNNLGVSANEINNTILKQIELDNYNAVEVIENKKYVMGDLNNTEVVDTDDVIYLLMHTLFKDEYPLSQRCDYNKDEIVDTNDVIYLLMHTLFSEEYPLIHYHSTTYINEKNPTCTESGNISYWYCSKCDKYFLDKEAGNEVSLEETKVDEALGHIEGEVQIENEVLPKCEEEGSHDEVSYCTRCNEELSRENVIDLKAIHAQNNSYDILNRSIDGYVLGLRYDDVALVTIYNNNTILTTETEKDGYYFFDNVPGGEYIIQVDVTGYELTLAEKVIVTSDEASAIDNSCNVIHHHIKLKQINSDDYYFVWNRTDIGSSEVSANINVPIEIEFLDNVENVVDKGLASELREKYNVVLLDTENKWSTEVINRFYELYTSLPENVTSDLKSVWTLTNYEIDNDIEFSLENDVYNVKVSLEAIANMTPRVAISEGETGKYFSKRFYHALVRFVTDNGNNAWKCEVILNTNFLTSFNVPNYSELTKGITDEDSSHFQEFLPEEKLLILTMFEEMPIGMHKMQELKYLVRRKTGESHPLYPSAAAVTWPTATFPYIEFMSTTFDSDDGYYHTKRLIIHEKMHMFYEHYFSDELKKAWQEVGGWYQNDNDIDEWSTTKQTEFVSAYAHGINPNEDMAESVATYIINPDLLRSRSIAKYEFIKKYVMKGNFYITQIREDLTFEVYNLDPDYTYPGQINRIEVHVTGDADEDKVVTITMQLEEGEELSGATHAVMRIAPENSDSDQYYDFHLSPINEKGTVLIGTMTFSKYSYSGYWYTDQITIEDLLGNERHESNSDYSLKVYINNSQEDLISPEYVKGSLELSLENAQNEQHPDAQFLVVKFAYIEEIGLKNALVRLYCRDGLKTSIDVYAQDYEIDHEKKQIIMRVFIPEHYTSGVYEISEIYLVDMARNKQYFRPAGNPLENSLIEIITTTPDNEAPILDLNNIKVHASPSNPQAPNGETFVTVTLNIKDNLSGVNKGFIRFVGPQGETHFEWLYFPDIYNNYFTGNPTVEQEYEFIITLPKGSAPGIWGIYEIALTDCALSTTVYNFTEILHFEVESK